MGEGELVEALKRLTHQADQHRAALDQLRVERRLLVEELRQRGWSLERIGREVGRTKQTVTQWLKG